MWKNSLVFDGREADGPLVSVEHCDEGVPEVDEQPGGGGDVVEAERAVGEHQRDANTLWKCNKYSIRYYARTFVFRTIQ